MRFTWPVHKLRCSKANSKIEMQQPSQKANQADKTRRRNQNKNGMRPLDTKQLTYDYVSDE